MNWYLGAFKKYAVFSGRARRKEYWYFVLFNTIAAFLFVLIDNVLGTIFSPQTPYGLFYFGYVLVALLPGLSLSVRRLHDMGRSGWSFFFGLIPVIGGFILLYFMVQDSEPGRNDYGPNPKEVMA